MYQLNLIVALTYKVNMEKSDIDRYKGILIENDKDRISARNEFLNANLHGLVADLGDGYFVVTKEMADHLKQLKIAFEEVELKDGVPPDVKKHVRELCLTNGEMSPF